MGVAELLASLREVLAVSAAALLMIVLLSWGAVTGINFYLGPIEDPPLTSRSGGDPRQAVPTSDLPVH